MGDKGTVWLPEGASTLAPDIDGLFYFVYWISVVIFIAVVITMLYFVYKYRRRSASDRPMPVHESKLLEAVWIVVPTILCLVVFTWGFQSFLKLSVAPPNAYQINATGQKWFWNFTYDTGKSSIGELHVPVNRPVRLQMVSQDVLHSFFIPAFRVKQDVLPNRYSSIWFEATKVDTFQVFCTEYCGTEHSGMLATVIVHSEGDFQEWLSGGDEYDPEAETLAEFGARLYENQACVTCHSVDGSRKVGPSFQGLYGNERQMQDGSTLIADDNYIRESILQPGANIVAGYQNVMPASYGNLTEDQINGLIAFIKEQQ